MKPGRSTAGGWARTGVWAAVGLAVVFGCFLVENLHRIRDQHRLSDFRTFYAAAGAMALPEAPSEALSAALPPPDRNGRRRGRRAAECGPAGDRPPTGRRRGRTA